MINVIYASGVKHRNVSAARHDAINALIRSEPYPRKVVMHHDTHSDLTFLDFENQVKSTFVIDEDGSAERVEYVGDDDEWLDN